VVSFVVVVVAAVAVVDVAVITVMRGVLHGLSATP
jgi:hypothetical protein